MSDCHPDRRIPDRHGRTEHLAYVFPVELNVGAVISLDVPVATVVVAVFAGVVW